MASVATPAVPIYRKVKSKDTVLPTRAAALLEIDSYPFYVLLLYRVFQLELRPHRKHCVLYFSKISEALFCVETAFYNRLFKEKYKGG
jgi:hypothetical protein